MTKRELIVSLVRERAKSTPNEIVEDWIADYFNSPASFRRFKKSLKAVNISELVKYSKELRAAGCEEHAIIVEAEIKRRTKGKLPSS